MTATRWALALVVLGYLGLAGMYSVATPILEASDEGAHQATVAWIAAGRGLPVLDPANRERLLSPGQEAGQPPLYYLLAAVATEWIHAPEPANATVANPHADIGHPDTSGWNKNLVVHSAAEDALPWSGLALAVHIGRLVSIAAAGVAIVLVCWLAGLALPSKPWTAVLAAASVAFNPMFLFVSASVGNDALAVALASGVVLLLAIAVRRGATRRGVLGTGTLVGLALLTKLNAAAVVIPAALTYLWLGWTERSLRRAAEYLALLLVPTLIVAGWWFARNWALYGDPTALNAFALVDPSRRPAPIGLDEVARELPGAWIAFWGVFGAFDILLPPLYYTVANVVSLLAVLGLALAVIKWGRRRAAVDPVVVLLIGWLALEFVLLVAWTTNTRASTGRLLFPAIASIAYLYARGLTVVLGRLTSVVPPMLAIGAVMVIPLAIQPAYAPPPFVPADELRPERTLGYRYGALELVAATLEPGPLSPASTAHVQLLWRAPGPAADDYVVSVQLRGPDDFLAGQTDVLPGNGKVLTSHWPRDQGLVDVIPVAIRPASPTPSLVHVTVYAYPLGKPLQPIEVVDASGRALDVPDVAEREVRDPTSATVTSATSLGTFGDQIQLVTAATSARAAIGGSLDVTLKWQTLRRPAADYTVFVHATAPDGHLAFQADSPPHNGRLPTADWVSGQVIEDAMTLVVPDQAQPGQYWLTVGLYDHATGARLNLSDGADELPLGSIEVDAAT